MGILSFLDKKAKPVVGLDISSTSVKLLELSRSGDRYRVESYTVKALPPNAVVEKNIADPAAVAEIVRSMVKQSKTKLKHAAVAVAGEIRMCVAPLVRVEREEGPGIRPLLGDRAEGVARHDLRALLVIGPGGLRAGDVVMGAALEEFEGARFVVRQHGHGEVGLPARLGR